jgi:hypothetical protein
MDHWNLAKVMYDTSSAVVAHLTEFGQDAEDAKQDAYADRHAIREARAHYAKTTVDNNVHRIAALIYKHAAEQGVLTLGAHRKLLAGRDKPFFSEAIDYGVGQRWFTATGGKVEMSAGTPPQ